MEYRSHMRPRSVRLKKQSAAGTAIVVLLSIVLIAAIIALSPLGTFLADNVFSPLFQKIAGPDKNDQIVSALSGQEANQTFAPSAAPKESVPAERILNLDELPFYILQMGVFTDKTAAEEHAEEIKRMGAAGYVYHDDAVYRVFAAAYLDEESLIKVQGQVRADGFEATPYITESSRIKLTLKGDQNAVEETTQAVGYLPDVPKALSELSLSFDKGECTEREVQERVKDLLDACENKLMFFASCKDDSLERFSTVLSEYEKSISTFLNEYDTIVSDERSGALKHLQIETIIDYILFFDQP